MTERGGHVMLNIRIDVDDVDGLIEAGRRSLDRDEGWTPGQVDLEPSPERETIIDSPEQAAADLLVEAWVRCYGSEGRPPTEKPLIEPVTAARFGDIDNKDFYPHEIRVRPWMRTQQ